MHSFCDFVGSYIIKLSQFGEIEASGEIFNGSHTKVFAYG